MVNSIGRLLLKASDSTVARRVCTSSVLLVTLIVATYLTLRSGNELRYPDEKQYYLLGRALAEGRGYVNEEGVATAYRPPIYPFLLSLVYRISPTPVAGKLANCLFLVGAAGAVYVLANRLTSGGGLFGVLIFALYPLLTYSATTLYPQVLGSALMALSIFGLQLGSTRFSQVVLSGLVYGLLVLTIPTFALTVPIVMWYLRKTNIERPNHAGAVMPLTFLLCTTMAVLPWTLRNFYVFGAFVPVSTNSGENLLLGNCENTTPNSGVNVDISHYRSAAENLDEVNRDAYFRRHAILWIRGNIYDATVLYFGKVVNCFNYRNVLRTSKESTCFRNFSLFISYYPLLLLVLFRFYLMPNFSISLFEKFLYVLYFGNACLSAIFFTRIRFRVPFDVLLIIIVGAFVAHVLRNRVSTEPEVYRDVRSA